MPTLLVGKASDDLVLPQRADLVFAKPKLRQNLVGLLAEFRRPRRRLALGARQRE